MQDILQPFSTPTKKDTARVSFFVAQRKGFEPLYTFLHNTISNRARSTAPPSLQTAYLLYIILIKNATVFITFLQKNPHRAPKYAMGFLHYIKVIISCDASTIKINAIGYVEA